VGTNCSVCYQHYSLGVAAGSVVGVAGRCQVFGQVVSHVVLFMVGR
jgi:hypothetical protein